MAVRRGLEGPADGRLTLDGPLARVPGLFSLAEADGEAPLRIGTSDWRTVSVGGPGSLESLRAARHEPRRGVPCQHPT